VNNIVQNFILNEYDSEASPLYSYNQPTVSYKCLFVLIRAPVSVQECSTNQSRTPNIIMALRKAFTRTRYPAFPGT
jgi:hypothetical protein